MSFRGDCGLHNVVIDEQVNRVGLVTAVLQARIAEEPQGPEFAPVIPQVRFAAAVGFLRLLLTASVHSADHRELASKLQQARLLAGGLEAENNRLRQELRRVLMMEAPPAEPPRRGPPTNGIVRHMLDYVRAHYSKPISLASVAAALRRNPSYLSALFVQETGIGFHDYLDELRLDHARQLLRDPLRSVAEVACESGYSSEDWFRHAFKAHTGFAPSEWRETKAA